MEQPTNDPRHGACVIESTIQFQSALRRRRLLNAAIALLAMVLLLFALVLPATGSQDAATGSSTRATTGPTTHPADAIMDRLLRQRSGQGDPADGPTTQSGDTLLDPADLAGAADRATGPGNAAIAPDTPAMRLVREGSYVVDRVGRIVPAGEAGALEFVFEADGAAPATAVDPPMLLIPNLNLMAVERTLEAGASRRFRVTGRVTEYRGRNYLLLEKVIFLQ